MSAGLRTESLGLSIGVANFVAARVGSAPLTRKSVLTLSDHRASELAAPDDETTPTETGVVMRGFVERVGDQTPLVGPDGTMHLGAALTSEALDAMARTIGYGTPVSIAVPAHWSEGQCAALREALFTQQALATAGGMPPVLIPDATAGLAALYAKPGFPTGGVVALCDFGASGTNVTLTDAASNYQQIGPTVRYTEFSGDRIDQLILSRLQHGAANAANPDHTSTGPIGSLSRRLHECRCAKEQLSVATMAVVRAEMPGFGQDAQLSRTEFEQIVSGPLDRFVDRVEQILQRNGVPKANLAAAATVGGGACIPLITSRLSERLQAHVFTTPEPAFSAAIGAAVLGQQRSTGSAPTAAGAGVETPADTSAGRPTEVAPAGWAVRAAQEAAGEAAADHDRSATYRALAWSQEASSALEPIPYAGDDAGDDDEGEGESEGPVAAPKEVQPWYTRPTFVLGVAGVAAVLLLGGVVAAAFELARVPNPTKVPANITPPVESSAIEPATQLPSETGPTSTGTEIPPPPSTTMSNPPTNTWATTEPTVTTTQPTPTTTRPTTTSPTTTVPSTTAPTNSVYPSMTKPWPQTTTPHGTATITRVPTTRVTPPYGY